MKKKRTIQIILLVLVLALLLSLRLLFYPLINSISARIRTEGSSMEPSLPAQTYIIVDRMADGLDDLARGDIVVFRLPRNPQQEQIKRVIGLPGETVRIVDGVVTINDQALNEAYVNEATAYEGSWTVPDGELFVLGDKRNHSSDSHNWGFVPEAYLIGKAVFIYWPAELWGAIERPAYGSFDP